MPSVLAEGGGSAFTFAAGMQRLWSSRLFKALMERCRDLKAGCLTGLANPEESDGPATDSKGSSAVVYIAPPR